MDNAPCSRLPEEELRDIARHVKDHLPANASNDSYSDQILKLQNLLGRVYSTASQSELSVTHNVASWNCLCALIDQSLASPSTSAQEVILQSDIISKCCKLYLKQGAYVRPKQAKQLLTTIGNCLKKFRGHSNVQWVNQTLVQSLRGELLNGTRGKGFKSTLLMLSHLLAKGIVTADEFSSVPTTDLSTPSADIGNSPVNDRFDLYEVLMKLAIIGEYASSIGQLLSTILSPKAGATIEGRHVQNPRWSGALQKAFSDSPGDVDKLATYVLPVVFRHNVAEFAVFLEDLGWNSRDGIGNENQYETLLCASLVTVNAIGVLSHVDETPLETNQPGRVSVSHHQIDSLLEKVSAACRITGLTLLVASPALTRPFKSRTLNLLRKHLQHLHADTDADFRGELFGIATKLFDRLRAATALLERQSRSANDSEAGTAINILQMHRDFLRWYFGFLEWETRPTASYQRHICATRCFLIAVKSGIDDRVPQKNLSKSAQGPTKWGFRMNVMHVSTMQLLLDLLMDPFEDVRQLASECLSMYSDVCIRSEGADLDTLANALESAERRMLASGRADHCDGVAHLNAQIALREAVDSSKGHHVSTSYTLDNLVQKLHDALDIAKADLSIAVKNYPLHGLLTSLRYILMADRTTQSMATNTVQRLLPLIQDVWHVVRDVLCDDAPEGYLPETSTDVLVASTKDILSFSWRALKEASLLTGTILVLLPSLQLDDNSRMKCKDSLCNFTFTQLAELRHRGSFSTVAQTWVLCCTQGRQSPNSIGSSESLAWYSRVLTLLRDKVTINTRRSAGLPALLCGILVADSSGDIFERATSDLEAISRSPVEARLVHEGSLPQVHAMNCIKDILKNSRLSERSERYITPALRLAADSLLAQAWAIRNCGLMLFRAVIDRMVGTNDPFDEEESSQKFDLFEQHPGLIETILSLLQPRASSSETGVQRGEAVFPALQLLQRSRVPDANLLDVQVAVLELTCSSSWHIRAMAARTYAALVKLDEAQDEVSFVLTIASTKHQNGLHGALLCAKHLVRRQIQLLQASSSSSNRLRWCKEIEDQHLCILKSKLLFEQNSCDVTRASWIHLWRESQSLLRLARSLPSPQDAAPAGTSGNNGLDAFAELRAVLETDAGSSLLVSSLRQALAAAAADSLSNAPFDEEQLLHLYSDLARRDANAFGIAFSSIEQLQLQDPRVAALIIKLLRQNSLPPITKVHLRNCLLTILGNHETQYGSTGEFGTPDTLACDISTPYAMGILIELQALLIESSAASRQDLDDYLGQWVGACNLILRDPLDYTRESVARGMAHFDSTFNYLNSQAVSEEISLSLMMMTYDILNDDDEDVRLSASKVAGILVRRFGQSKGTSSPLVASQRLLGYIVRTWEHSTEFAAEAFARAFGTRSSGSTSISECAHRLAQDDSVLFAEEKQNLYIDDAREARTWSQVIMRLGPHTIRYEVITELSKWTSEGLDFLLTEAKQGLKLYERSSEADIFTLVMRLFYGVEVLLWCVNKGLRLPYRPSVLLEKLHQIAGGLRQQEKGNLWHLEAQRILDVAVTVRLRSMRRLIENVVVR
ncbi:hypothetical protein K431DRAFT_297894 [Polychaeton citri CBS 116435]|uniref:DUF2428 domain-containing protein n=1 Tax=Polychaeton citri CBS 116435 TaxID=1314669 RepID=A0A9P4UL09_9PEZI|nr:hypothetical protein K431DRAFT_297894 [Polychaeton citri CBS 116435]